MFIDSDKNTGFLNGEENYLNHPGLFGWCWKGKKKCEAERYDKAVSSYSNQFPLDSTMGCDEIDSTISDIDNEITSVLNSGAKSRVVSRNSRALENRRLDFKQAWEDANCSQIRLDEQSAEFERNIQNMFNEANERSRNRKVEDDTLKYVALGVGTLVIGAIVVMALRKKK